MKEKKNKEKRAIISRQRGVRSRRMIMSSTCASSARALARINSDAATPYSDLLAAAL